jgi:hypothetical protein
MAHSLVKVYMGNASGSQSFTMIPADRKVDAQLLAMTVQELAMHGDDTTWQVGEASEVPDGDDYNGDAPAEDIFNSVVAWLK